MIAELMQRYSEAHAVRPTYEIRRLIPIDGHEVAWMRRTNGAKRYGLYCECYFTEGVGWRMDDDYGVMGMAGRDDYIYYKTAIDLRRRELHKQYAERFLGRRTAKSADLVPYLDEIVADLLERGQRGEFIGEAGQMWGGHFYAQTLAQILGVGDAYLVPRVEEMRTGGKITLVGSTICRPTKTAVASPSRS